MRFESLTRWRATRAFRAVVLAATLLLGGAMHEWHHAVDHHCEEGGSAATEHPCGCAPMHSASLPVESCTAPAPAGSGWVGVAPAALAAPAPAPRTRTAPRGPPAA